MCGGGGGKLLLGRTSRKIAWKTLWPQTTQTRQEKLWPTYNSDKVSPPSRQGRADSSPFAPPAPCSDEASSGGLYLIFFDGAPPRATLVGTDGRQALHFPPSCVVWEGLKGAKREGLSTGDAKEAPRQQLVCGVGQGRPQERLLVLAQSVTKPVSQPNWEVLLGEGKAGALNPTETLPDCDRGSSRSSSCLSQFLGSCDRSPLECQEFAQRCLKGKSSEEEGREGEHPLRLHFKGPHLDPAPCPPSELPGRTAGQNSPPRELHLPPPFPRWRRLLRTTPLEGRLHTSGALSWRGRGGP